MLARPLDLPCDASAAFAAVADLEGVAFLHSGVQAYGLGRYSILAAEPGKRLMYRDGCLEIEEEGVARRERQSLPEALATHLNSVTGPKPQDLPFYGGAIGYLSYEAGRHWETTALSALATDQNEAAFAFYRGALVFDHLENRVYAAGQDEKALDALEPVAGRVAAGLPAVLSPFALHGRLNSNFSREEFIGAVARVRECIREGEVYQVNLAQRFSGLCSGQAADLYLRLAYRSPAPYAAYLDFGDEQIVSSSPERFLWLRNGQVATRPIKGTRPAGRTQEEAERYGSELAASEKERSELLMIVDLERNDLGRVCEPGSVEVQELFAQERYATVIHQVAEVVGELESGRTLVDCMGAMFPGGSITGAPKIRAMQVINELEKAPRGVYTGAIGYVDSGGGADFNVAIRTIRVARGELSFHVGGGIVWDSDPESEYEETLLKGQAMKAAIEDSND